MIDFAILIIATGLVVNLLLNLVGLVKCLEVFIPVGLHGKTIEPVDSPQGGSRGSITVKGCRQLGIRNPLHLAEGADIRPE